jgi:hypothetical protein
MVNLPWYGGADIGAMPQLSAVGMLCYLINLRSTWLGLVRTLAAVQIVTDLLAHSNVT